MIRKQDQEIKLQRKRNEELRKKLEDVEDYKLARTDENQARKSVNCTHLLSPLIMSYTYSFLGEQLTYEDFHLIRDSVKFLALAKEEDSQDHLLVLTPTGTAYLKENFSINVNRHGKTRTNKNGLRGKVETFPRIHIRDIHRLDNR